MSFTKWRYSRFILILSVLMLSIGGITSSAQNAPVPASVGNRGDAPPYALHGSYWVGTQDFVVDPEAEFQLRITAWYPALNPSGAVEAAVYRIERVNIVEDITPPGTQLEALGHALTSADPDSSGGPYPLVIWSHGYSAWRQGYTYSPEHLASWGFVVLAPEHLKETPSGGIEQHWPSYVTRPMDVTRTIDYGESDLNTAGGALAGMIDFEQVAVAGHSFGGWTAVTEGGAVFDTRTWADWCAGTFEDGSEHAALEDCVAQGYMTQMAELIGLDAVPDGLWPAMNDPRVDALVSFAPGAAWQFGGEGLAAVQIPAMILFGDQDADVGRVEDGGLAVYQNISSPQKAMVRFQNAGHFIFVDECSTMPWAVDIGLELLCTDPVWDMKRAHDLINHFSTAFLLDVMKGDAEAHAALSPDAVAFTGIIYEAEGF